MGSGTVIGGPGDSKAYVVPAAAPVRNHKVSLGRIEHILLESVDGDAVQEKPFCVGYCAERARRTGFGTNCQPSPHHAVVLLHLSLQLLQEAVVGSHCCAHRCGEDQVVLSASILLQAGPLGHLVQSSPRVFLPNLLQ